MSAERKKQCKILTVSRKAAKKFRSLYTPEHERLCWTWRGKLNKWGYGVFHAGANGEYAYIPAHRAAYLYKHGALPDDMEVLHDCNNRRCVNPHHLFLVPHDETNRDLLRKKSEAMLTAAEVEYIKERINEGKNNAELARQFSVVPQAICNIRRGRNWTWVKPDIKPEYLMSPAHHSLRPKNAVIF